MSTVDVNITGNVIVKTAAEWAADVTVYKKTKILFTSDVFYDGTTFPKFKKGNDVNTWGDLDYFPDPTESDSIITKTAAEWAADVTVYGNDQLLVSSDEVYIETDTPKIKIGNGSDVWEDLDYLPLDLEILISTEANWTADTTVYPTGRMLFTFDVKYHGTNQMRYKVATGFSTWSELDYAPAPILNYTRAERDAIVSPQASDRIFNTTDQRMEYYDSFFGWTPVGSIPYDWGYSYFDEGLGAGGGFFTYAGSGSTIINTNYAFSSINPVGLSTGATLAAHRFMTGVIFKGGTGKKYFKMPVIVNSLSTVSDRYIAIVGYSSATIGLTTANGMFFLYDEGGVYGTATASPNWLCVCRDGGSTTVVDSTIAVETTASPMQRLEIMDDGTGTTVVFKINGVVVATISSNMPTSISSFAAGARIQKTAGGLDRILYFDYAVATEKLNTIRL